MKLQSLAFVMPLAAIGWAGCSDDGTPSGQGDGRETQQATVCREGAATTTCYCPDGSQQQQECLADGELGPCPCPTATVDPGGGGILLPDPTGGGGRPESPVALCPELQNVGVCAEPATFEAEELPSYVLFVVDRSGSMRCNPPPTQTSEVCEEDAAPADTDLPSKWDIVTDVLRDVIDRLAGQGIHAGLTLFATDTACGVDSEPLAPIAELSPSHAQTLKAALDIYPPRGLTPIVGATTLAYRHLHDEARLQGNRYVVLLTDGFETCNPEGMQDLLDVELPKSRDAFIRTFVVGVPGAEPGRGFLSELAYRGGTARSPDCVHAADGEGDVGDCHYDMTLNPEGFGDELRDALVEIGGQTMGCEFPVPQDGAEAPTASNINVQYVAGGTEEPVCLTSDFETPCEDPAQAGWQFPTHPDGSRDLSRVVVCGSACETLKEDVRAKVEVIVGCPPIR